MLADSQYYFQKAADVLGLPDRLREILLTPLRVVKVELVELPLNAQKSWLN